MKKLSLKNLKVVKLTSQEKKAIKGGGWDTSDQCNRTSGPYVMGCYTGTPEDK
ncbi:hypothetical protein K6T82_05745 [Flavobacterium sp. 17A]|uniref:Uncharacterized protein n=1 Tax=Flavobacterium potami TaxID=2872310 RepID=A0A9X1H8S4_9FLAO|nr:hypothetical protein [Flavobacterium potami]MBZ4034260.1 hypothetical protein [Flavobacterium potami]